jgi:hypothetical protein
MPIDNVPPWEIPYSRSYALGFNSSAIEFAGINDAPQHALLFD